VTGKWLRKAKEKQECGVRERVEVQKIEMLGSGAIRIIGGNDEMEVRPGYGAYTHQMREW